MATFTKVTPGHACKVAASIGSNWVAPKGSYGVEEAIDADGCIVAYHDAAGWFVHASYARINVSGTAA